MAEPDKRPVTVQELLVFSLVQTDALAKLLIEKGLITREEFMQKISEERATYQKLQLFSAYFRGKGGQSSNVSPRSRKAVHEPVADRVIVKRHDNRNRNSCFFGGTG